jgi:hypothetical protein
VHIKSASQHFSTLRAFQALACQQISFSRFGLALVRATNRYQRQSGSALSAELRDDWLKC